VDLSAPLTYSTGLKGNAATIFGGNEDTGTYTVGLGADVQQKYRFDLKYIDWFGRYRDNGTAVTTQNGFTTLLKDRGFVSLTFKTTYKGGKEEPPHASRRSGARARLGQHRRGGRVARRREEAWRHADRDRRRKGRQRGRNDP